MENISIPNKKKYINKKGEEKEYIYDQQLYNKKYYTSHKENYKTKYKCDICNVEILQSNKSNHFKSMKHINQKVINYEKNTDKNISQEIK